MKSKLILSLAGVLMMCAQTAYAQEASDDQASTNPTMVACKADIDTLCKDTADGREVVGVDTIDEPSADASTELGQAGADGSYRAYRFESARKSLEDLVAEHPAGAKNEQTRRRHRLSPEPHRGGDVQVVRIPLEVTIEFLDERHRRAGLRPPHRSRRSKPLARSRSSRCRTGPSRVRSRSRNKPPHLRRRPRPRKVQSA